MLVALNVFAAPEFRPLDLAAFFNHTNSAPLPEQTTLRGVPFKLGGAVRVTGLDGARRGDFWPDAVTGLPVRTKAARLHLLLGALHGAREGEPLANVVLHFQNGESRALRIAYGVHTRNVWLEREAEDSELADPNSQLAWQTNVGRFAMRLHHAVFDNPRPSEEITRLDFISLFSHATPALFAVTLQDDAASALRPLAKNKILSRATELNDTAYRRELRVRATDLAGQPLTNTKATFSIADGSASFFIGEARTDAAGRATMAYPPQDAVTLTVRVEHPGFAPASVALTTRAAAPWPDPLEVRLERGQTIGGTVVDTEQTPVVGAEVLPSAVTATGPNEFAREVFSRAITGSNGQWSAQVSPTALTNLSVYVTHPDFHPASAVPTVTELLAGRARVALRPHVRLAGRVLDAAGQPVLQATVFLHHPDEDMRASCTVDSEGRFKFIIQAPSDDAADLVAVSSNLAPVLLTTRLNRTALALNFRLGTGQPFAMRLTDGDDAPLAGINVSLQRWQQSQALPWSAITDAQGRFAWSHAPTGAVTWRFEKPGSINHTHSMTLPQKDEASYVHQRPIRIAGRVVEEVSQRPLDSFRYRVSYKYANGSGSSSGTGRRGAFNTSLGSASKYTEVSVVIEAADYEPLNVVLKPPYGLATNDFPMRKAKLIEATVVTRDGKPVPQAEVVLLAKTASAYMDAPGKFRRTSTSYDVALTDQNGRVSLTPKLDADLVLAAHPQLGFAQISTNEFLKAGRIVLEPWGVVQGVLRVGPRVEPDHYVAIHTHALAVSSEQRSSALYMYYRLQPEPDGSFFCAAVPPGERMVQLRYFTPNESDLMRLSHNQPVTVKAGETNDVMIGGTGRTVTGRIELRDLPGVKMDGKRGEFLLRLRPGPQPSEIPPPLNIPPRVTATERQQLMAEHQAKIQVAARNRTRASRFLQRQYVLLFDDNNGFTVPNVPPGDYTVVITPQDPRQPRNTTRNLFNTSYPVKIPEGAGVFDLGTTITQTRNPSQ